MNLIPENTGGGRVVEELSLSLGDESSGQVLILNSHHVNLGLFIKLLFSSKKIIHRLAGPLSIVRPGVVGAVEDEIIRVLNGFA